MKKKIAFGAVVLSLTAILVVLAFFLLSPYKCCLDILNAAIVANCTFEPFYGGVPGKPLVRDILPGVAELEAAFPLIRAEMEAVLKDRAVIPRMYNAYNQMFFKENGKFAAPFWQVMSEIIYGSDVQIFDKIGSDKWKTFNLIMFNQDIPVNAARCPVTVSLLRKIPGVQSALFSIIAPGTYIPPHSDPAKGVIRYHLALKVPREREKCHITVHGQRYCWTEGHSVLFDDVFDHEVRNDTDEERVILFVDILRPLTGFAAFMQWIANTANAHYPGVKRAIRASVVTPTTL